MPSTYSSNLKLELMATGENSGTWGSITNTNLGTAVEQAIIGYGTVDYVADANLTISITNSNSAQAARALVLNVTSGFGSLTQTRELVVPTIEKQYIVQNNTTGGQSITVKTSGGTGITVPNGRKAHLYVDGTNVIQMFDFVDINGGTIDGTTIGGSSAAAGSFTTLGASGAATFNGAVTLGDAAADLIVFNGTVNSHLLFTDNTYDIGASGATRPRNLYLAGAATIGGNLSVGGTLTLTGGVNLNGNVTVGDSSADTLTINSTITSNLLFTDNTYDIGASGATRPRNLFLAGNATIGGNQTLTGSLTVDSTTDSTSTITGSIQTDGGLGVAKALFVGTTANIAGNVTLGSLTSGRVPYASTAGLLVDSANLLYSGTDLTVYGITVGRGAGAVSTNTAVGASALAANTTGAYNVALGWSALSSNQTGSSNIAIGWGANRTGTSNGNVNIGAASGYDMTTANSNIAIGDNAMRYLSSGSYNVGIGTQALQANTTASNNTAVGYQAGYSNTTGATNTALGTQALYSNSTGNGVVAVGTYAAYSNTANDNVAVGANSLRFNTSGTRNVAVGSGVYGTDYGALGYNTSGANNTAIGVQALLQNTTASNNTAVGYQAGYSNTTGTGNVAVGNTALYSNTTTGGHVAIGNGALFYSNTTGTGSNIAIGSGAGFSITTGMGHVAIGQGALYANTTGSANTAVGGYDGATAAAMRFNTTGSYNSAFGVGALAANTTANNNTAVGYQAGYSNTTGTQNTAVGGIALYTNATGNNLTALGYGALRLATAVENTSVGSTSSYNLSTGTANTALGHAAMYSTTTGSYNTALGDRALYSNTTASSNTAVGYQAGYSNTTGSSNVAVGYQAEYQVTTGQYNIAVGYQALYSVTDALYSVAVGHRAGISNTGSANVFIGALAGYSNTSSIGNVFIGGGVYGLTNPSGYLTTGGRNTFVGAASGHLVTSGAKNTILGNFDGNQGGLDIRTADNYIVLSDGDGNPRLFMNSTGAGRVTSGNFSVGADPYAIGYGPQFFFGDGAGGAMGMLNAQSINTNDYPVVLTANAYCTGVNTFAYVTSSANASRIRMNQGAVNFAGADTGTAGSAITFTEILSVKKDETLALQGAGRYSGTGITFPATQSASSDANTLDDYEEGAWTPTTSAGGVTVTNLNSYYTKIGRLVHVYAYVEVNNSGGTLGGIAWTGLPFAALSYAPALRYYKAGTGSASTQIWAADTYTESGSAQIIDNNDIGSGVSQIMISATYFVA